jgi:hypothetical protein
MMSTTTNMETPKNYASRDLGELMANITVAFYSLVEDDSKDTNDITKAIETKLTKKPTIAQLQELSTKLLQVIRGANERLVDTRKQRDLWHQKYDAAQVTIRSMEKPQPAVIDEPAPIPDKPAPIPVVKPAPIPDNELLERRRSIVVAGLPESKKSKLSGRVEDDTIQVQKILDITKTEAKPIAIYRINPRIVPGEVATTPTKPRLLKVIFASTSHRTTTLRNSRDLKETESFRNVFLRPSMTKEERKSDFDLRKAVKGLRDAGKTNVLIKNSKLYVDNTEYSVSTLLPVI